MKYIFRKFLFPLFAKLNLAQLLIKYSSKKFIILNYHGVVPNPNTSISVNHKSVIEFEKEIKYFRKYFQIIHLEELMQKHQNKTFGKNKYLAITFDDGYENNYKFAYPILKKYKIPATIFIVSENIDSNEPIWYDVIDVLKEHISNTENRESINKILTKYNLHLNQNWNASDLKNSLKKTVPSIKKNIINDIIKMQSIPKDAFSGNEEYWKIINSKQIKEMVESGLISFQSHTHTHPNLDEIPADITSNEIATSKNIIQSITGVDVNSIAFPDGAYNDEVKKICYLSGYSYCYSVNSRLKSDLTDDKILNRFSISNTTTAESILFHVSKYFM